MARVPSVDWSSITTRSTSTFLLASTAMHAVPMFVSSLRAGMTTEIANLAVLSGGGRKRTRFRSACSRLVSRIEVTAMGEGPRMAPKIVEAPHAGAAMQYAAESGGIAAEA